MTEESKTIMQEAIKNKQTKNEICKRFIFGGMSAGETICRTCGHPRRRHFKNPRGPQISSRAYLPTDQLEAEDAMPWQMFAEKVGGVTYDLMTKVGYDHDIKISIKKLSGDHPAAPGYEVVAKTRLP